MSWLGKKLLGHKRDAAKITTWGCFCEGEDHANCGDVRTWLVRSGLRKQGFYEKKSKIRGFAMISTWANKLNDKVVVETHVFGR